MSTKILHIGYFTVNKKILLISLSCGLTALFLSACALVEILKPTPIAPREPWISKWLENPACQPPCWEGITPGKSTMTETITVLNTMTGIDISGPSRDYTDRKRLLISWNYQNSQSSGEAETDENGLIINEMYLSIDHQQQVILREIINIYGSPDNVLINRNHAGTCDISLMNKKGFVLNEIVPYFWEKCKISPSSQVYSIQFFSYEIQDYIREWGNYELYLSGGLMDWNGYTWYKYPKIK